MDEIENIIVGGDFNCPLNPVVDKRGGSLIPRQSVISTIEQLQSELDLHDIWQIKNPTIRSIPGVNQTLWSFQDWTIGLFRST